jgi:hypothetical protein
MTDYSHHRASRDVQVVLVPIPVAGTIRETHRAEPPRYPYDRREAWRPATRPPTKAQRVGRWLDQLRRQEEAVREMLKPDLALLKARWGMAA